MRRNVFFIAGVLTLIVFVAGILFGMWLDEMRLQKVKEQLSEIDILWNDARLQNLYYQTFTNQSQFCESEIEANLEYNNRIYQEGLRIEKYEEVNKFEPSIVLEKKRYALLQFQFWMNSISLKKKCNADYSTLVHLYSSNESVALDQKLQSVVLLDLKNKCGRSLMLIPMPSDLNIIAIDLIKKNYNITTMPAIIINETVSLQGLQTSDELEKYVKC